jgi:hypothetical protein
MLDIAAGAILRRDGTRLLPASYRLAWLPFFLEPAFASRSCWRFVLAVVSIIVLGLGAAASPAAAQTGRQVLLVVNAASPSSAQIGDYYAKARSDHQAYVAGAG